MPGTKFQTNTVKDFSAYPVFVKDLLWILFASISEGFLKGFGVNISLMKMTCKGIGCICHPKVSTSVTGYTKIGRSIRNSDCSVTLNLIFLAKWNHWRLYRYCGKRRVIRVLVGGVTRTKNIEKK